VRNTHKAISLNFRYSYKYLAPDRAELGTITVDAVTDGTETLLVTASAIGVAKRDAFAAQFHTEKHVKEIQPLVGIVAEGLTGCSTLAQHGMSFLQKAEQKILYH
jgi:hypothetical protein